MPDIAASDVAALRKQTGAGMMDSKRALEASGGDLERAKQWLREHSLAKGDRRAGREADQGAIDVVLETVGDTQVGVLVEVNCETDFVAKGAAFGSLVAKLARHVASNGEADLSVQPFEGTTVAEAVAELSGTLGEKLQLGRVVRYETPDGLVDAYKHIQNERGVIGVLVELGGVERADPGAQALAHDIALHIASAAPRYVTRAEVPADVVTKEREVLETLTRNEGKPTQAIPKIVEGRLNGFYKEVVLVDQGFVKEPKTTIGSLVGSLGPDAVVRRFTRIKIGED